MSRAWLVGATRAALAALAVCAPLALGLRWCGDVQAGQPATREYAEARDYMVDHEIVAAGIKDPRVIAAMRATPRHEFVIASQLKKAYFDMALPIGDSQTISPPFVVAYMTEQLDPQSTDRVLEIGTGSGYQAAVLSPLVKDVYTIEIVKPLGERARRTLKRLAYPNVYTKIGDGYLGWPEHAPFDKIIVTCSPEKVPQPLIDQLREGGRMIVPVGERYEQTLYLFKKEGGKLSREALLPTLFVPMTGEAESARKIKPDPLHPRINNGTFEAMLEGSEDKAAPLRLKGWHYQRQLAVSEKKDAPQGARYVTFSNSEPGRASRALQGVALDGRAVRRLEVSLWVKATDVEMGQTAQDVPALGIVFYDQRRAQLGTTLIGPWQGTSPWRHVSESVSVPAAAREMIIHLGLHGATGQISFDNVQIVSGGAPVP